MTARSRLATSQEWEPSDFDHEPRRRERSVGLISPLRVLLFLVVLIAGGVAFYGMFMEQSPTQLPMSITGLGLLALSMFLLSISLARAAAQLGRRGRGGKALLAALIGGIFILGASGAAAGAIILAILVVL